MRGKERARRGAAERAGPDRGASAVHGVPAGDAGAAWEDGEAGVSRRRSAVPRHQVVQGLAATRAVLQDQGRGARKEAFLGRWGFFFFLCLSLTGVETRPFTHEPKPVVSTWYLKLPSDLTVSPDALTPCNPMDSKVAYLRRFYLSGSDHPLFEE